jgi:proteasome accessory factor C
VTRPADTAGRLRQLLAVLAWLAQVGEADVDEVAARFELTPAELVTELEMAACCGLPPYTPDQLMEIVVTDTTISARLGPALARPRRLSAPEGFALAASARAVLAAGDGGDDGALARALAKLETALGVGGIAVELDAPAQLEVVRAAVAAGSDLAVTYYAASSDEVSDRRITPERLFASEGHWYLDAWCHTAEAVRRFRVDRILEAAPLPAAAPSEGADGRGGGQMAPGGAAYVPGPDSQRVVLAVDPGVEWVVEALPAAERIGERHGRGLWELYVGGTAWLERLLLRLGPGTDVLEPSDERDLAARAAARILARYGRGT